MKTLLCAFLACLIVLAVPIGWVALLCFSLQHGHEGYRWISWAIILIGGGILIWSVYRRNNE